MRIETIEHAIYKFSELSEAVQQHAIEARRCAESSDWDADYIIDNIKETAAKFGLSIDNFYYSGFYSQGDGASFTGEYRYKTGGLMAVKDQWPSSHALHSIVESLQKLQASYFYRLSCTLYQRGHYYHENTMYLGGFEIGDTSPSYDTSEIETDLLECLRSFAQWTYSLLESEYDYRTSDEACRESLIDGGYEFTEDGEVI